MSDDRIYNIVRFYKNSYRRRIIHARVTLEEAQEWCRDTETSSSTANSSEAKARTRRVGPWFDGYEQR